MCYYQRDKAPLRISGGLPYGTPRPQTRASTCPCLHAHKGSLLGDERAELLAVLLARAVVAGRVLAADAEGARDVVLGDDEEGLDAEPEAGGRMVRRVRFRMDFPRCEKNCLEMSCRNSVRFAKDGHHCSEIMLYCNIHTTLVDISSAKFCKFCTGSCQNSTPAYFCESH